MAESSLSLNIVDLNAEVGFFLGHGRGSIFPYTDPTWDAQQQAAISSVVKSGLRRFYFPEPLPGDSGSYDWSFLKPLATLLLLNAQNTLPLPDDFGGIEGQATLSATVNSAWYALPIVGEGLIRAEFSRTPLATGRPRMLAQVPLKGTPGGQGQRFGLMVYPTPDADYSIQFTYYINPDALDLTNPFAYGGLAHVETIREACLAAAEDTLDDAQTVHASRFVQRLAASISMDRRLRPETLGYNGDRSDGRRHWRGDYHGLGQITVNGIVY